MYGLFYRLKGIDLVDSKGVVSFMARLNIEVTLI